MIRSPKKRRREIVRKLFHIIFGLLVVLLFSVTSGAVASAVLAIVFAVGMTLSELYLREIKLPGVCDILHMCDREHHLKERPGFGPIRFILGALITRLLFPAKIAIASIILLTFVDAISAIVGGHIGRFKIPWSRKKSIEGSLAGFLAGIITVSIILPIEVAVFASAVAAFVESFDVDDNLPVPLSAGFAIQLWGLFR